MNLMVGVSLKMIFPKGEQDSLCKFVPKAWRILLRAFHVAGHRKVWEIFMNLKKFAMLMISCAVLYGISGNTASAATEDGGTNIQIVQQTSQPAEDGKKDLGNVPAATSVPQVTASPQPAVAPRVTARPSNVKNNTVSKGKKVKKAAKKSAKKSYTKAELRLMAAIINCEAGSESYQGKLAVGIVIMNRVRSSKFPNTVKKVIYQKRQFSPVRNGSLKKRLRQYDRGKIRSSQWKSCISAAKKALSGQKTIVYKGRVKSMKKYKFFSVRLRGAKMRLGGHRFK